MDILEISILILATIAFVYALFRFIQDRNLKHLAREYERNASHCEEKIINNPHHLNVNAEKEALKIMKKRYVQLKNKFKNEPKMLAEIAKDWEDYVKSIFEFVSEKIVFEIDFEDHYGESVAVERFKKRVAASILRKDKIEERFGKLLGIRDISMKYIKLGSYEAKE